MHGACNLDGSQVAGNTLGADVGGAVGVPVDARTTAGAAKHAPPWCGSVTMTTRTTSTGGEGFIVQGDAHLESGRLLRQVAAELTVGPLADFLVGVPPLPHPIADVTHVAHRQFTHPVLMSEGDSLAGRLMEDVPLLAVAFGRRPILLALKPFPAAVALLAAGLPLLIGGVALVAKLLDVAEQPPADDERVPILGTKDRDVDLAQIDPDDLPRHRQGVGLRWWGHRDGEGHLVVVSPPQQLHLTDVGPLEACGQGQHEVGLPTSVWQHQVPALQPDCLPLPRHGLVGFLAVGVAHDRLAAHRLLPLAVRASRIHIGNQLFVKRLHALAMEPIAPALGAGFQLTLS